jgi:DNA recombination protein RmuC
VLTQAKRFEDLSIDTGGKAIELLPVVDQTTRPMVKLVEAPAQDEDAA